MVQISLIAVAAAFFAITSAQSVSISHPCPVIPTGSNLRDIYCGYQLEAAGISRSDLLAAQAARGGTGTGMVEDATFECFNGTSTLNYQIQCVAGTCDVPNSEDPLEAHCRGVRH